MKGRKLFFTLGCNFFTVFPSLFFFVTVQLYPISTVQGMDNKIDWKRFGQCESLQARYAFLDIYLVDI